MLKRPLVIGLSLVALAVLVLLNLPRTASARLKLAVSSLFLPLFGLAGTAERLGEFSGTRLLPRGVLAAEVDKLRGENEQLRLQVMQGLETARENDLLREAVAWQKKLPWKVRLARVIARDPSNWWRTLQINLGADAGVAKNMPVITSQGLVGRIHEVGAQTARVVLLGDPQCPVPAVVDNPTRDTGTLLPGESSVLDESIVEMTYLPRGSQAIPGQKVFTSGLGGFFPKGIPVGTILSTNSVDYGLYLQARVKLSASLQELEEVFVLYP